MEYKFPKNVRQIGNVSDTPKIYVEDYVDTFLNQLYDSEDEKPVGAFLVGEKIQKDDKECIYISGAIRMEEIDFIGPDISISETTIGIANAEREKYFEHDFIGWCISVPGRPLHLNSNLNKLHHSLFGKKGDVLILKDAQTKEEVYYAYKYKELMLIAGHYIYYEKNPAMQEYMIMSRKKIGVTPSENVEDQAAKNFRNIVREKTAYQEQRGFAKMTQAASLFLVAVVVVMGIITKNNYEKMQAMQTSVEYLQSAAKGETTKEVEEDEILVVSDEVEAVPEIPEEAKAEKDIDEATEQNAVSTMQEMSEDIYIVEAGDTLARISKKIYGDVGHVDAICRMNGLTDGNLIFIGQKLLLP